MIRIETQQTPRQLTFKASGQLCGSNVEALAECWKHVNEPLAEKAVDLPEVTSVDRAGRRLLRSMRKQGVEVSGTGLSSRSILASLMEKEETC